MIDAKVCGFCHQPIERGAIHISYGGYGVFCMRPVCERAAWELAEEERAIKRREFRTTERCIFDVAWRGYCGEAGWPACEKHRELCSACKKNLAIRECDSASSLVCGRPLCKNCRCPNHGY